MKNTVALIFLLGGLCTCSAPKKTAGSGDETDFTILSEVVDSTLLPINADEGIMPTFQGGDVSAFRNWINSNVEYPEQLFNDYINGKTSTLEGRVIATFIVNKEGWITDVEILKSPHNLLSVSVRNTLDRSPRWTPGYNEEGPVHVRYTLPVDFMIKESKRIWLNKEREKKRKSSYHSPSVWR